MRKQTEVAERYVSRRIRAIEELLRQIREEPWFLQFKDVSNWDEETFIKKFEKVNFYDCYSFDKSQTRLDYLERKAELIAEICDDLMASFTPYMTKNQLNFVKAVFESQLANGYIYPIHYDIEIISQENNQKEIGEEIYRLSKMKK